VRKTYKIVLLFISIVTAISLNAITKIKHSYANTTNDDLERREMLVDTALAYKRKNENYQYDLYRENKFTSPEEINSYNKSYAVCSTFVYQVYYNSLGIKIPFSSKNHLNNASKLNENNTNKYIRYYTKDNIKKLNGNTLLDKLLTFEKNASNYLEKGDIVTIGYGANGHTLMVYDVKKNERVSLIDNNGSVYDYKNNKENYEEKGSINIHNNLSTVLEEFFMSNNDFTFNAISFIKIIADGKYLSFSNSTVKQNQFPNNDLLKSGKIRYKYKGMDVEKTHTIKNNDCSTTKSLYANLNSEITYTISIKNNSNQSYNGMKVTENIDTNKVDFITSNKGIYNNGKVTFTNINVKSNETIKLTYTVKVKNISNNLYSSISSTGKIDETLNLKTININIGNTLSDYQKNTILSNYSKISTNDTSGKEYIKKIYKNYFKYNLEFQSEPFISYENNTKHIVKNTKINDEKNIILSNLYGLKLSDADNPYKNYINVYKAWRYWTYNTNCVPDEENNCYIVTNDPNVLSEYKNRIRTLDYNMLETGDIILTDNKAYMYIYENNKPKLIFNAKEKYTDKSVEAFLRDLVGNNYTILRPALNDSFIKKTYKITYKSNEKDTRNIPKDDIYVYSTIEECKFPITSQIPKRDGYTFTGWMLDSNNSIIFQPSTNWKQSNQRDYVLTATWKKNENEEENKQDEPGNNNADNKNEPDIDNNILNNSSNNSSNNQTIKFKLKETKNIIVYKEVLDNSAYIITIVSKDEKQFKELDGYELSENKKELSKLYTEDEDVIEDINIKFENGQFEKIKLDVSNYESDKQLLSIIIIVVIITVLTLLILLIKYKRSKKHILE